MSEHVGDSLSSNTSLIVRYFSLTGKRDYINVGQPSWRSCMQEETHMILGYLTTRSRGRVGTIEYPWESPYPEDVSKTFHEEYLRTHDGHTMPSLIRSTIDIFMRVRKRRQGT
jgi:hypothetical protein